ncbi:BRO family protein [Nocardia sp. NPDC019255]|uniref:phage antirepressor n=1 Tax=Nocardia sp. NPDC019255 TaxID=3154591 RepID=UPI00341170D3
MVVDGDAEFVAADVCRVLGHSNPSVAVAGLDDDERGLRIVETPSGAQQMVTVTEAGLYTLIIRSRKPEAKKFRRWVTHEVLPAIRRTGNYSIVPADYPAALEEAARQARKAIEQKARADAAEARVAELEPKAEAFDAFLNGEGLYLIGTVGRMIGVGQTTLFRFLYENRVLMPSGPRRKQPYANPKFDGWFRLRPHDESRTNGHPSLTTMATARGAEGIRLLAIEKGLIQPQLIALPSLLNKEIGA